METIVQGWLSIWLYVMVGVGIYLGWQVYRNRATWSRVQILCTLAVIVLVLHVLEEWVFPGGLHYSYNLSHGSEVLSRYPMNRLTDMVTNFGGVILGVVVLKVWGFRKPAGIAIMLFSGFEVVIHVTIGITSMQTFGTYGMSTLYSPGLVTALFGFLPVAVGLAIELFGKAPRPTAKQWVMAVATMFALCFLLINLPEDLLGSPDSPYAFTDRGYYAQYAQAFEADTGLTY
ncbi:MAG: HXXEE domain-containing protein [Atopobiaceae bacterium]|jgi:hypothetical protein|nr:HXXEE domain-containing protein [Atopobiaceae bacterium]MCH4214814.1 HXXEE domain-containing protein [Atopobiaceae bacterium]MCH4230234.1 HXXEE domain-containing protein [Atopobiaceae bacterium]MCH4276798.1 HXXEE domain-containing protein [Atopobiaceae bacterium]MCI1226143.1 HXXEE domain-containing protein [Atopobiaceae bacterium]